MKGRGLPKVHSVGRINVSPEDMQVKQAQGENFVSELPPAQRVVFEIPSSPESDE